MELVNSVFNIAEEFMKNSEFVFMNKPSIELLSKEINKTVKYKPEKQYPSFKEIMIELVASSINYCYWYGKSTIRPNGSSSSYLYENIKNVFYDYDETAPDSFEESIQTLISNLSMKRFPLLEERVQHLNQLVKNRNGETFVNLLDKKEYSPEFYFNELVTTFPGFASDIFLKRASLFFLQLYREFGWFEEMMDKLFVPADYQIPRVLNHYGCINYIEKVDKKIINSKLIPKHSKLECEIRSATILTIEQLCNNTGWNVSDIDVYLFNKRYSVEKPFHLTITTDY